MTIEHCDFPLSHILCFPSSIALISLFTVNKQVITVNKQMGVLGGP